MELYPSAVVAGLVGTLTGWLYAVSTGALVVVVAAIQFRAVVGMLAMRLRPSAG